jgi:hypothetical protein
MVGNKKFKQTLLRKANPRKTEKKVRKKKKIELFVYVGVNCLSVSAI